MVFAALTRIDSEHPGSGKLKPYDYKDQSILVRTIGADWENRAKLPHPLRDNINFVEDAVE